MSLPGSLNDIDDIYLVFDYMETDLSKIISGYKTKNIQLEKDARKLIIH
jgi:hypothetical protein